MKPRICLTGRKLKWLASLLGLVFLAGVAPASERLPIPEQTSLPFWQRDLGASKSGDFVFVFYRPLADVPAAFNFHDFFDFNIDPSVPLLVQGFLLTEKGSPFPKQVELKNAEGAQVVICIVDVNELATTTFFTNKPFTIGDLLAMESLRIGQADFYHETLHPFDPTEPTAPSMIELVAKGVLKDGRSFFVQTAASQLIVRIGQ